MDKIICINPGHGGSDPGAVVKHKGITYEEDDFNLAISLYQAERFQQLGIKPILTRWKDEDDPLAEAAREIRESGAAICLCNHNNSDGDSVPEEPAPGEAGGVETIHSIYSDGKLATMICDAIVGTGLMSKRRVFSRRYPGRDDWDYYYMHRETGRVQVIIIEYGFLTNTRDLAVINDPAKRVVLAEAVIKATCQYANWEYKPPVIIPPTTMEGWKVWGINLLAEEGITDSPQYWKGHIEEGMPVWAATIMMAKLMERIKKLELSK